MLTQEEQEVLAIIRAERMAKQPNYEALATANIRKYKQQFDEMHHLDKLDYQICIICGSLGAIMDSLFVGIPQASQRGEPTGFINKMIQSYINKKFPQEEMIKLSTQKCAKVTYDAQDNRNTRITVEGLSAYYHRVASLGHDPVLGFFVGVFDIIRGTMTTISKTGEFTSQKMEVYADRMCTQILDAVQKQWNHFKSDVNTPMGLPVPLMALFNFLQFGKIGEEKNTIAEVVQGMYYDGYDFQHFLAMSVPEIFVEILVRAAWWIRMKHSGHSLLKTTPLFIGRKRTPKLQTMLTISHSVICTANGLKVWVTKNPCAINYPEWVRFLQLLGKELEWQLLGKSVEKRLYVSDLVLSHKQSSSL